MAKVVLEGNADVVEFCPNNPYLQILAAASYNLQEEHLQEGCPVRVGGLYLFSAEQRHTDSLSSTVFLAQLHHQETHGVFDIKWRPYDDGPPCLAQASADGSMSLHTLRECDVHDPSSSGAETLMLEFQEKAIVDVSSSMCLFVDWNPIHSNPQLALSHSDGSISLIDLGQSKPEITASWLAHDFESWVVSYDLWKPQIIYSGGDDCQFCGWDLREDPHCLLFRDKKIHKMGVCSIQSNPLWENILVTGSYDENIRLWDLRMMQKPLMKAELGLGGGVWRLKWHPFDRELIIGACMHNGFAIARVGEADIQALEEYKEHMSLAYGASWYRGNCEDVLNSPKDTSKAHRGVEFTVHRLLSDEVKSGQEHCKLLRDKEGVFLCRGVEGSEPLLKSDVLAAEDTCNERSLAVKLKNLDMESTVPTLLNPKVAKSLVATCSFYDRALHLWLPKTLSYSTG